MTDSTFHFLLESRVHKLVQVIAYFYLIIFVGIFHIGQVKYSYLHRIKVQKLFVYCMIIFEM